MRIIYVALIVSALACLSGAAALAEQAAQDETIEPGLTFSLTLGDKTVPIVEGKPVQVSGKFSDPKVTLNIDPHRVFDLRGARFDYPRHFTWEADLTDPNVAVWTLSGTTFKIMFFAFQGDTSAESVVESLEENFTGQGAEVAKKPCKLTLEGKAIAGTQLDLTLVGNKLIDQVYGLPGGDGVSRLVIFQDTPNENGQPSAEAVETLKRFSESFKSAGAKK
ncbi:MAG: hypothetical protein KF708_11095 [Pirellulales bacterium]|nr:hypothetical protein [Pirellulales bacterium]